MVWVYVFSNARKRERRLVLCRHRRKFLMIEIHRNLEDEKIGQG
jgi:hypothetical protein